MIRVLYVIATLDPHGAERQLCLLASRLDRTRFEPVVCCLTRGGPLEAVLRQHDVEVVHLHKAWKLDMTVIAPLARLIRRRHIDIVHTWMFTANAFGRTAAWIARAPVIVASERGMDWWKTSVHFAIDRVLCGLTDAIVANSLGVRDFVRAQVPVRDSQLLVIPNGIETQRLKVSRPAADGRASLGIPAGAPLVCSAGRLTPQKGFDILTDAVAEIRRRGMDLHAVIVGEGELRDALKRQIAACRLESCVHLLGFREDLPDIMAASDLFVLLSAFEGMPNVVLEAMALGLPVIASDVGGIGELIEPEQSGIVLEFPLDQARVAEKIEKILRFPAHAKAMGRKARQTVLAQFGPERMAGKYEELYERLSCKSI